MRLRSGPGGRPGWTRRAGADRPIAMWAMLYPTPAVVDVVRRGSAPPAGMQREAEFLVLPAHGSRMLVPPDRRVGAAMAKARRRLTTTLGHRTLWTGLSLGLRSGLVQAIFPDRLVVDVVADGEASHPGNLSAALTQLFGQPVVLGINVGRARANRKPVVHVLDVSGRTLGFCKIGWNKMTSELLGREAATLTELAGIEFRHVQVPRVLFLHGDGARDYLGLTALDGARWQPFRRRAKILLAMSEVARSGSCTRAGLGASAWWARTGRRAHEFSRETSADALPQILDRIEVADGLTEIVFGRWHGDWSPWNMTLGPTGVLAWDWERSSPEVPVGFDGLHFELQSQLEHRGMTRALRHTHLRAARIMAGFADQQAPARLVLELYLVSLYLRYAEDAILMEDVVLAASARDILTFLNQMVTG